MAKIDVAAQGGGDTVGDGRKLIGLLLDVGAGVGP